MKPTGISIVTGEPTIFFDTDGIDCAYGLGGRGQPIEMRHDCLFVRYSDIGTA